MYDRELVAAVSLRKPNILRHAPLLHLSSPPPPNNMQDNIQMTNLRLPYAMRT